MIAFARSVAAAAVIVLGVAPCSAGDEALYGDQPSRNAVFVRFVNATDAALSIKTNLLPPTALDGTAGHLLGSYATIDRRPVAPLAITATGEEGTRGDETIELKSGTKVSIVVRRQGKALTFKTFATPLEADAGRTVLSFINAATGCGPTSLKLEPAGATIFADVPVDDERSRKINPVNARLSAACGSHDTAGATLERSDPGSVVSVWLLTLGGRPTLIVHADAFPGWHP